MTRRLGWLIVPVLAVLVWWLVRGGDPTTQATHASAPPSAAAPAEPAGVTGHPSTVPSPDPARTDPAPPPAPAAPDGTADPTPRPGAPSTRPAQPAPAVDPVAPVRPAAPAAGSGSSDASSGGLADKTGWADNSAIKQLNKELTPLMSECIDQAKARNPRLHGTLALSMTVAPTENHKIIVSVTPARGNQIDDPELLECIRESSFSVEGLKAPHDFQVSMLID